MTYCEEVIITKITRGKGTPESVCRMVVQIYKKDGTLIAESDPCGNFTQEDTYELVKMMAGKNISEFWDVYQNFSNKKTTTP